MSHCHLLKYSSVEYPSQKFVVTFYRQMLTKSIHNELVFSLYFLLTAYQPCSNNWPLIFKNHVTESLYTTYDRLIDIFYILPTNLSTVSIDDLSRMFWQLATAVQKNNVHRKSTPTGGLATPYQVFQQLTISSIEPYSYILRPSFHWPKELCKGFLTILYGICSSIFINL